MDKRILGNGLEVSEIGLGCMGMSEFYGPTDDEESLKVLHKAVDLGCNFSIRRILTVTLTMKS